MSIKKIVRTPEDNRREQLENEVVRLNKKIAKYEALELKQNRYGLVWLDVPEAFEDDVENKLPILEENPKLAIKGKDGKPTHLLIEGDNYHALTCLNYTHKGKVDVIYIDPPYNTGSDGFRYKDKRILDKFPDGTEVPTDHPLRHSYWLSFIQKRIELARDLLNENGCIFISIDENELGQLKIVCDSIFKEDHCHGILTWIKRSKPTNMGKARFKLQQNAEYILLYSKSSAEDFPAFKISEGKKKEYPDVGKFGKCRFEDLERRNTGSMIRNTMIYSLLGCLPRKGYRWQISKQEAERLINEKKVELVKGRPKVAVYPTDEDPVSFVPFWSHLTDTGTAENGKAELSKILGHDHGFDTVKPVALMKQIINHFKKDAVILDFFAGSGTTAQAVLELNKEEGNEGKRQFILITDNENNIMSEVCYPRIKKVIKGFDNYAPLGGVVKFFKTAFVGKNNILKADDGDKIELARNAGGMLAIAENTFDQIEKTDYWQIFESEKQYTAIYFREEFAKYDEFERKVKLLKKPVVVYIFSWEKELGFDEFEDDKNVTVKTIPQPILEIYKQIYNLV